MYENTQFNTFSRKTLFNILKYKERKLSKNVTLHSFFVTENKVITVLVYTLINLGINTLSNVVKY